MDSYILNTDGTVTPMPKPAEADGTFSLKQLQEVVEGMIALIPLGLHQVNRNSCPVYFAVVNEEGLIHGLEKNPIGTYLLGSQTNPIVGPVVILPEARFK